MASSKVQFIEAFAIDKNKIEHLVGKLKVLPNDVVYDLPVVFVGVTTHLSGVKGNPKNGL